MKTLLVVEDEPFVMKFLRQMLKGYNVVEAAGAVEALMLLSILIIRSIFYLPA